MVPSASPFSTPPSSAQLRAVDLTVELAGSTILRQVSLGLNPGDRAGLVGPNGVGKSTLLRALAGELTPTAGTVTVTPPGATVGLLTQELPVVAGETVLDHVARRVGVTVASDELDRATEGLAGPTAGSAGSAGGGAAGADPLDAYQAALDRWLGLGGDDLERRLAAAVADVGLSDDEAALAWPADRLSGGQQARVGLAALVVARQDVLLLDEPTNDLDGDGLALLEELVTSTDRPVLVVSHDRRFLDRVVTSVVELDGHHRTATTHHHDWTGFLRARDLAAAEAQRRYDDYRDRRDDLSQRAQRQREWATKGVRAQRRPPDNDKAQRKLRIEHTEQQAAKARRAERAMERLEAVDKPWQPWELRFSIGSAGRSGDLVAALVEAEVDRDRFRLGPTTVTVTAGERVELTGANGAGKSTLLAALLGEVGLTAGTARVGPSVVVGRLDQERRHRPDDRPFLDRFQSWAGLDVGPARSLLAKFGLESEHLARPSHQWSPGERTRAALALFQAREVNTIVLDEPTNHLDLPAIEQLEQALGRFEGTLLVVSHDRAFVDGLALTRRIELVRGMVRADEER